MRSAANTLLRIIAWGLVIFGTLFTLLQVWIVGLPLFLVGGVGIFATNSPTTDANESNEAPLEHDHQTDNLQRMHDELLMDEDDFEPSPEERWRNERSIDEMLGDDV